MDKNGVELSFQVIAILILIVIVLVILIIAYNGQLTKLFDIFKGFIIE